MEHIIIQCWTCGKDFKTQNEMSTHHLDMHERPQPISWFKQPPWAIDPTTAAPYQPPNWKAQAAREYTVNGARP
jgi:hypothetical protein